MRQTKNILIAPLNWGLGHATRCIPIIKNLRQQGHRLIIASDGMALKLLKKEFPGLEFETLPAYNITYARNPFFKRWPFFKQIPHLIKTIQKEKKITLELIKKYNLDMIISDNRFGVYSKDVKSVYITHQLRVLSGWTTPVTTLIHYNFYKKYDEIWVPDVAGKPNLSGELGHYSKLPPGKIKYIGILSRMHPQKLEKKYDLLAILSGPEPQRSQLEKNLLEKFKTLNLKTALIRGVIERKKIIENQQQITIYNYVTGKELEQLINQSGAVICRSGYTSIMDMAGMQKKILMIPTPGQDEQIYLGKHLAENFGISIQNQDNIKLSTNILDNLKNINI